MEVPCVRVPRREGERVRQQLADLDAVDRRFRIDATDEWVYIPICSESGIDVAWEIVERDVRKRKQLTLPSDLLETEARYERLGDIALIDEDNSEDAKALADALLTADLPIKTVLNRRSAISGERRVRDWEIIAGDETETVHREFGAEFLVDVTVAYFSPRLATERHRVTNQVHPGEHTFDMFAGVGPYIIQFAKRGAIGVGVDINPHAITYLEENAERNGVSESVTAIHGDVRDVANDYEGWADRIVMNLPHRANEFLDAAKTIAGDACELHFYDIQPREDPFGAGESAIRSVMEPQYTVTVERRHVVRSYSPDAVNCCLDVRLEK